MSYNDTYYSLSVPSSGFDFNTTSPVILISSSISSTTSVSADANISLYVVSGSSSATTDVTASALLINIAATSIAINPTVSISSVALIINASGAISITPTFSVSATTSGTLGISGSLLSNSSFLVSSIDKLSTSVLEDTGDIKAFFIIDNIPLTEHNRITSFNSTPKYVVNSNWRGGKGVYFKNTNNKRDFTFEWSFVPGKRQNTVDLNAGRDYISKIGSDAGAHTLKIRKMDTDGLTAHTEDSYNVLVTNYSETLIRRDLNNDEYYWNCSLTLQEV